MYRFHPLGLALLATFALLAGGGVAQAKDVQVGNLVFETPWSRATPGGAKLGVGYLAIVNIGNKADRLLSATSPIAERVEIHLTSMDGGIMKMRKLEDGIEIKAQEVTELKPGGLHLMLIGLKQTIVKGAKFPVRLTFKGAGEIELTFVAAGIGARRPPVNPDLEKAKGSNAGRAGTRGSAQGQN